MQNKSHHRKGAFLRIMHVLSGDLWAGAEVMAWTLLKGLCAKPDVSLKAVLLNEGTPAQAIREAGLDVCILDEQQLSFPRLLSELRRHLREFSPHIVHAHRYKENLLCYAAAIGMRPRPVLISTQHGLPEIYGSHSLKTRLITQGNFLLLSRLFGITVSVSREMQSVLVSNYGFRPEKVAMVYNGINLPELDRIDSEGFCIGTCGRMVPVKNYSLFLKVAARIAEGRPEIRFILAGDGPEREYLTILAARNGLNGKLSMPGHLQEMDSFYRTIDLYVNTSIHEGIPMSVLEAMGYGVPVVVPHVGGFNEIVDHGKEGFLVPPNDSGLFAKRCLQLYSDKHLRTNMSRAARSKIEEKFSMDRMTDAYLHLYEKMSNQVCR